MTVITKMNSEIVAVYYMAKDGGDWALYLQSKLNTKEYAIETVLNDLGCDSSYHTKSSRLNVFLITPEFLDRYQLGSFFERFEKTTSLLILTGTELSDVERQTEAYSCAHILEWLIHQLDADDESVRELMLTIIGVYEGHMDKHLGRQTPEHGDSVYDTLPKARQINKVYDILQKDDKVYVMLERLPEGQVTIQFPLDKIKPTFLSKASLFVFDCSDIEDSEFKVLQEGDKIGEGKLIDSGRHIYQSMSKSFSSTSTQTESEDIIGAKPNTDNGYDNEYLKPPRPHKPVPVHSVSSSKSKLELIRELLEYETDPERLLCECFGIEKDVKKLDEKLASLVESAETLKHLSLLDKTDVKEESADVTWPTLLHFGAEFNLVNFCDVLLSNPFLYYCCSMTNKDDMLPHQLAQLRGHTDLAEMLKQFLKFIKAAGKDGKHDSGFSTDTPRLSTISQHIDRDGSYVAPPVPHMTSYVGQYLNEIEQNDEENDEYLNEAELRKIRETNVSGYQQHKLSIMSDTGYSDSIQEESDEDDSILDGLSPLPSPHDSVFSTGSDVFYSPEERRQKPVVAPFEGVLDISKLPAYDPHKLSKSVTEPIMQHRVGEPHFRRKDIISHLGIETSHEADVLSSSPTSDHKKKMGFFKMFKSNKPKIRSKSEPSFPKTDFDQHLRRKKETHYKKTCPEFRSSGTSSGSTASTISAESKDDEDSHSSSYLAKGRTGHYIGVGKHCMFLPDTPELPDDVDLRDSGKSKKTLKQMLVSKRRKSIRMKNVLRDANLSGPKLPSRKDRVTEFF